MHTVRAAELQRWVDRRRLRPHPARRVLPARTRDHATGRCATTWPPPAPTTRARPASWPARWPMPPSARPSARGTRSGTPRSLRLLVVGGGGREHALCWALRRENPDADLFCAPGNPGTAELATNLPIAADDLDRLADAADMHGIDLTVVGPEVPLARGLADRLRAEGRAVFGPCAAAARTRGLQGVLQGGHAPRPACLRPRAAPSRISPPRWRTSTGTPSRSWSRRRALPPARARWCAPPARRRPPPCAPCWTSGAFGDAGRDRRGRGFLDGEEFSVLAITDGQGIELLPASQDHKRLLEGDAGPNTGGMGAYSPVAIATPALLDRGPPRGPGADPGRDAAPRDAVHRRALRRAHGRRRRHSLGRGVQLPAGRSRDAGRAAAGVGRAYRRAWSVAQGRVSGRSPDAWARRR